MIATTALTVAAYAAATAYAYDIPWLDDGHEASAAPARPRFDLWAIADRIVSAILSTAVTVIAAVVVLSIVVAFLSISRGSASAVSFAQGATHSVGGDDLFLQVKDFITVTLGS
jgi:hypothetical protein